MSSTSTPVVTIRFLLRTRMDTSGRTPSFRPMATTLIAHRFLEGTYTSQVTLLAADGVAQPVAMGPLAENPAPDFFFSPDGTKILAHYPSLNETWIIDA